MQGQHRPIMNTHVITEGFYNELIDKLGLRDPVSDKVG